LYRQRIKSLLLWLSPFPALRIDRRHRAFSAAKGSSSMQERDYGSGTEIQARVQAMVDADPVLQSSPKRITVPMPKPTATESVTGCNWTIHYLGQFPGFEPQLDAIVEIVQYDLGIAGPASLAMAGQSSSTR
jgi:hypothetical protein